MNMLSSRKIRLLRFFERLLLVGTTGFVIGLAWLSAEGKLGVSESYAGGGVVVLGMLAIFFIQRKIDSWLTLLVEQTNYGQDDAFTALYERSPVAYVTIDTQGRVLESNPASVKLLNAEASTMSQVNFFQLILGDDATSAPVLTHKITAGITINDQEVLMQTVTGEQIWVMLSVFAHRSAGMRLVSLVDISEQKQVDTAKSEFVALATHQLRTPIAAIRWNVELLQKNLREVKTEKHDRYLTKIERNVFRMLDLINDFLSVSKLEMGTYAAETEVVNLSEYFDGIIDEFSEKISAKQIVLDRQDEPPQAVVKIDRRLFHIIVSNLVSNAVKYLNPEGTLQLRYRLHGEMLQIDVADNGIGIPAGEIDRLFTKFYRASNAQQHQTEGTGLGLYIVKQAAEQLGGTITVSSEADQGAHFTTAIPVTVVSSQDIG